MTLESRLEGLQCRGSSHLFRKVVPKPDRVWVEQGAGDAEATAQLMVLVLIASGASFGWLEVRCWNAQLPFDALVKRGHFCCCFLVPQCRKLDLGKHVSLSETLADLPTVPIFRDMSRIFSNILQHS